MAITSLREQLCNKLSQNEIQKLEQEILCLVSKNRPDANLDAHRTIVNNWFDCKLNANDLPSEMSREYIFSQVPSMISESILKDAYWQALNVLLGRSEEAPNRKSKNLTNEEFVNDFFVRLGDRARNQKDRYFVGPNNELFAINVNAKFCGLAAKHIHTQFTHFKTERISFKSRSVSVPNIDEFPGSRHPTDGDVGAVEEFFHEARACLSCNELRAFQMKWFKNCTDEHIAKELNVCKNKAEELLEQAHKKLRGRFE